MDNKIVIRRLFDEVLNDKNLDVLDDLIPENYVDHNPLPDTPPSAEGVKLKIQGMRSAFPDLHFFLEQLVCENDFVAARYHWSGTQKGAFGNIPATRKKVSVNGMDFYRIEDGKIVEHWHTIDELGLLRQLGIV